MTYCQPSSYSFHTQGGNLSFVGTSAYHPYGGYAPHVPMSNYGPSHNGPMYPSGVPPNSYLFYAQPINPLPNSPIYPNYGPTGLFADSTGYVTPFVHWIKDYSLLDRLKMPSHAGSYDGKGPDNYLHLFKGAIRMQKWAMHVACHMFIYTFKDSARIWWNRQKAGKEVATNGAPNDHKDGFDRFNKGFSWDNNKGKKKNQDRFSPYKGSNHGLLTNLSKSPREILTTKKVAKAFEQPPQMIEEAIKSGKLAHLVKGIKKGKAKASDTQLGEWKKGDKDIVPAEASILMISRESPALKRKSAENYINGTWDITFPHVSGFDNSSDLHCFLKLKPSIRALRVDSKVPLVGFLGEHSWPLGEVRFSPQSTPRKDCYAKDRLKEGQKKIKETIPEATKNVLSCADAKEKIMINDKHPEKTIVIGKQLPTSFKRKLQDLMLNEYKHIEPVKQKKRGLAPEQHKAAFKEVDELTKASILREVKYQTWVANLVMVLTNKPIKKILARLEKSRQIAKCAIELGEHDIEFKGRNYVKGHVLADFLAETPSVEGKDIKIKKPEETNEEPKSEDMWKLYTDGASSSDGSGADMMLVSPEGKEYTYTLRFEFKTTNNEVEYEALLAGLRITADMKIKDLSIFVDSQLVANHVKGLFKTRQPVIKQYLDKTKEVLESFNSNSMEHVQRDQNKKAGFLNKLASMTFLRLANEVLVEVLPEKSIVQKKVADIINEEGTNWMSPIREYLLYGLLPRDPQRKL
ncbi:reverse transcriptase domain-containing protein [Tanacetum coccineum]